MIHLVRQDLYVRHVSTVLPGTPPVRLAVNERKRQTRFMSNLLTSVCSGLALWCQANHRVLSDHEFNRRLRYLQDQSLSDSG